MTREREIARGTETNNMLVARWLSSPPQVGKSVFPGRVLTLVLTVALLTTALGVTSAPTAAAESP